jgi:Protein of unknown function (DUF3892)
MARKRIVCINKFPTHQDPYHHITDVGIGSPAGWTERMPVQEVISQLRAPFGDRYFVLGKDGSEADVRLGRCPHCHAAHEFIRTTPDHSKEDNLLSQSECRIG